MAVGHFYSLALHGRQLRHLAAAEGPREHDMGVPDRLKPPPYRVLIVHDKAGIGFGFLNRRQQEPAVCFHQPGQGRHGL